MAKVSLQLHLCIAQFVDFMTLLIIKNTNLASKFKSMFFKVTPGTKHAIFMQLWYFFTSLAYAENNSKFCTQLGSLYTKAVSMQVRAVRGLQIIGYFLLPKDLPTCIINTGEGDVFYSETSTDHAVAEPLQ